METQIESKAIPKEKKLNFKDSKYATGRRKKSIARVWVKKGSGIIHVNGKKMIDYFVKLNLQTAIVRTFAVAKRENEFDVKMYSKRWRSFWSSWCNNTWNS